MFAYEMVERKIKSLLERKDEEAFEAFKKIVFILKKFAQAQDFVDSLVPLKYEFLAGIKGDLESASLFEEMREFFLKKLMLPILYEGQELQIEINKLNEEFERFQERLQQYTERASAGEKIRIIVPVNISLN